MKNWIDPRTMGAHMNAQQVLAELAKNDGAILHWQVSDAEAFKAAHAEGKIGMDWETDCFVHPMALKISDLGYSLFKVEDTGGGCQAYVCETERACFVITDSSGCFLPCNCGPSVLGVYDSRDAWTEGDDGGWREFEELGDALRAAQAILDGE